MTTNYSIVTTKKDATTKHLQLENTIIDCDSTVDGNTVKNIDVGNLKTQDTTGADEDKVIICKADGTWQKALNKQYLLVSTFGDGAGGLKAGDAKILYYHSSAETIATKSYTQGMYIWSATLADYVACSIAGNIDVDGTTITKNTDNELTLQTGDATKGIQTSHICTTALTTSAETFPATVDAASDEKLITEKAAVTQLLKKVPYHADSVRTDISFGVDSDGCLYWNIP